MQSVKPEIEVLESGLSLWRIFSNALISILALLLLVYAGYGETLLTVKKIRQEQAGAQAGLVRTSIENSIHSGIPLDDIAGLDRLAQSTLLADSGVTSMTIVDSSGRQIYPRHSGEILLNREVTAETMGMAEDDDAISFRLPLNGRLEAEGYLQVVLSKSAIDTMVDQIFSPLFVIVLALVVLTLPASWLLARSPLPRFWREQGWFTLSFSLMSLVLVLVLTGLYIQSAGNQVRQVNDSLLTRLSAADSHGIPLNMLSGIDGLLKEYHMLNPELQAITLSQNSVITHSSDYEMIGRPLAGDFYQLSDESLLASGGMRLTTTMPFSEVVLQVLRAGKNFTALYLTTLLLSLLFNRLVRQPSLHKAKLSGKVSDRTLEILHPLFFIAVFMESLYTAILPELLNQAATHAGLGTGLTSILFMLYFLSFALMLLPGNRLCSRWGNHPMLLMGFTMAVAGALLLFTGLSANSGVELIILARVLAGAGQGLLMVAVQNEILANTSASNRTSGASIIVISFNGGFICGTALGALLASYLGSQGVFMISALSGCVGFVIAALMLERSRLKNLAANNNSLRSYENPSSNLAEYGRLVKHRGFLGAMACIGLPAKATLTGIVTFTLPLLLSRQGFASEDIGQIIIAYAIAVLLGTRLLSGWVDQKGNTAKILSWSMTLSGLATLTTATGFWLVGSEQVFMAVSIIIGGVFLLGLSHGGINAPVVSHVISVVDEQQISLQSTVTFYRFLERFGHVLGPLLAGQILIFATSGQQALVWMACGLFVLATMFAVVSHKRAVNTVPHSGRVGEAL
ncbi:MFS transporter [Parendozoicomonas sp. Alg238-R29]|uniref:MFS transporter n=1 Tax=Parendozoicomonas sp. Alg238-R29 TaxID=2993446 RepID=UPI00248EF66A|nr:MFS transporter [Parendozoicomonas sp. Alg238-R29]